MAQIFRNFGWNDNVKSFFCIVGTSWMGWGRVEWYWHMGMSYLTSLNTQLFKNIAYVGSFGHILFNLIFNVNSNLAESSANCSGGDLPPKPLGWSPWFLSLREEQLPEKFSVRMITWEGGRSWGLLGGWWWWWQEQDQQRWTCFRIVDFPAQVGPVRIRPVWRSKLLLTAATFHVTMTMMMK